MYIISSESSASHITMVMLGPFLPSFSLAFEPGTMHAINPIITYPHRRGGGYVLFLTTFSQILLNNSVTVKARAAKFKIPRPILPGKGSVLFFSSL